MKSKAELKQLAARAALDYVGPLIDERTVLGIGTGSTADCFIELLAGIRARLNATVASSEASAARLRAAGIPVLDLNAVDAVDIYVDGADEADAALRLIKGGGGAHTREKILATVAREFVCIGDASKLVDRLGAFPVAVEVIPMARSHVGREIVRLGGDPVYRQGALSDNGNILIDVHGLGLADPAAMESALNAITGVVENGIFAHRRADRLLLAGEDGVRALRRDG